MVVVVVVAVVLVALVVALVAVAVLVEGSGRGGMTRVLQPLHAACNPVHASGWLTELRTAAAGALAARHFAPADLATVAVIGCGIQVCAQPATVGAPACNRR